MIEHDAMRFDDRAPVTNSNAGNKPQPQARRDRAVVHLFYSATDTSIDACFKEGTYLNEELVVNGHAVIAPG